MYYSSLIATALSQGLVCLANRRVFYFQLTTEDKYTTFYVLASQSFRVILSHFS